VGGDEDDGVDAVSSVRPAWGSSAGIDESVVETEISGRGVGEVGVKGGDGEGERLRDAHKVPRPNMVHARSAMIPEVLQTLALSPMSTTGWEELPNGNHEFALVFDSTARIGTVSVDSLDTVWGTIVDIGTVGAPSRSRAKRDCEPSWSWRTPVAHRRSFGVV